ncbi:loganic acid O-methyltransferase-like [Tripterygium wilfordii]|uniref:loganic acid O-methyltransferase-like n=1 Tax=Tripterygium wilfordii TaxID=458696 RepID=UPI0018F849C0|nr:loganic acid O-methyltransferase-like [Tripterygium wilfordii]
MAGEKTTTPISMNGGDGRYSYTHNSSLQRNGVELMKAMINEAIAEKLDLVQLSSPNSFRIADLGCSVGPNTFTAVQNIIDSITLKCQTSYRSSEEANNLEFQVFFNDQISNDFNTLFKNLPSDRKYSAAGVPGPFQGRLFAKNSLHFVHSSYALHWLSSVPRELVDEDSLAFNKGRIHYSSSPKHVLKAYSAQFGIDTTSFLNARAQEVVHGGLMGILILCSPDGVPCSLCNVLAVYELLGASVVDLAKKALISEAKVDNFNLPMYNPTEKELKELIEKNGCFSIERMEPIIHERRFNIPMIIFHMRASLEGMISEHFGKNIVDQLFDLFAKKVVDSRIYSESSSYQAMVQLFVLLKRA